MNQDWVCSTGRKTKQNNTKNKKQIWSFYTVCAIVFIPFEFLRFTRVPWLFAFVLFLICFVWLVGFVFFLLLVVSYTEMCQERYPCEKQCYGVGG